MGKGRSGSSAAGTAGSPPGQDVPRCSCSPPSPDLCMSSDSTGDTAPVLLRPRTPFHPGHLPTSSWCPSASTITESCSQRKTAGAGARKLWEDRCVPLPCSQPLNHTARPPLEECTWSVFSLALLAALPMGPGVLLSLQNYCNVRATCKRRYAPCAAVGLLVIFSTGQQRHL